MGKQTSEAINNNDTVTGHEWMEMVRGMLKTMERAIEKGMMVALLVTAPLPSESIRPEESAAPAAGVRGPTDPIPGNAA